MSKQYSIKKAIIIEDEENSRLVLENLLKKHCPTIQIIGIAGSIREAIPLIINGTPDVVFLDIELPESNGFTLFEHFPPSTFGTIFVTAYSEYALKALKMSAIDYLLKPIDPEELVLAVDKLKERNVNEHNEKVGSLLHNINAGLTKIALPTLDGLIFVEMNNILRCEAENNYTTIYFTNKEKIVISKTLAFFDDLLGELPFFRVNRNALINMNFISKFQRGKKAIIFMEDGSEIVLPEPKKNEFISIFKS